MASRGLNRGPKWLDGASIFPLYFLKLLVLLRSDSGEQRRPKGSETNSIQTPRFPLAISPSKRPFKTQHCRVSRLPGARTVTQHSGQSGANFSKASLKRANFNGANIQGASFQSADLADADLRGAAGEANYSYNTILSIFPHISTFLRYNDGAGGSGMDPGQEVTDDRPANSRPGAAAFVFSEGVFRLLPFAEHARTPGTICAGATQQPPPQKCRAHGTTNGSGAADPAGILVVLKVGS